MRTLIWIATLLIGLCLGLLVGVVARAQAEETSAPPAAAEMKHGEESRIDLTKGKEIPKEIVEKLEADQLYKLMQMKMEKSADIPILAPLLVAIVFGCPVAIVAVVLFFRHRQNRQLHQTLATMIDKGVAIPPELLAPEERRPPSDLRRGIVLVATGIGVAVFLLLETEKAWGLGLIPLLIGVGYLIVWKLDQNKKAS